MNARKLWFPILLLGWVLSAAPAAGAPSPPGGGSSDSGIVVPVFPAPYYLSNPFPCVTDSVILVVTGYQATPCDSFAGAEVLDQHAVRIRYQYHDDYQCFVGPTFFYPVLLPLGLFPAGEESVTVDIQEAHIRGNVVTYRERRDALGFTVRARCDSIAPPPPPLPVPPPGELPYVDRIVLGRSVSPDPTVQVVCPGESIGVSISGTFPNDCFRLKRVELLPDMTARPIPGPPTIRLVVDDGACLGRVCQPGPQYWKAGLNLPPLPAGLSGVLGVQLAQVSCLDSIQPDHLFSTAVPFKVASRCDSTPPPPPGPLPYVDAITVGAGVLCRPDSQRICPGESILVSIWGHVPDNCLGFKRAELVPPPYPTFRVVPPVVRLLFGPTCCGCLRPCYEQPQYWATSVWLPALPGGGYELGVEVAQADCSDSTGRLLDSTGVGFQVPDSCPPPPGELCLTGHFRHTDAMNPSACDVTVGPGRPGQVTFYVNSRVALSGLQGSLVLSPPSLRIQDLQATGAAAGMHLTWNATASGAHFVLFAEHGAPIPANGSAYPGIEVLSITVDQPDGIRAPDRTELAARDLLGSDLAGHAVTVCQPPPCTRLLLREDVAVLCTRQPCDFNADGVADIRDLVLMVHCVNGDGACPDSAAASFDCNADRVFNLDDVLCCARSILTGPAPCNGCPPPQDSGQGGRPEPGVKLSLGAASRTAAGVDLPLRLEGAERLGAVRLVLGYPPDRFDVTSVELGTGHPEWLSLFQMDGGKLRIGLIRTGPSGGSAPAPAALDLRVHLALKPGQEPGGDVSAQEAQFSGADGAALQVGFDSSPRALLGPLQLSLSGNRPNPFSALTRFSITLDQPADVEVSVFDIAGRKVARLFGGRLEAGEQPFTWDGRSEGGASQPAGIYFYRATSQGRVISHKMTLLRRR